MSSGTPVARRFSVSMPLLETSEKGGEQPENCVEQALKWVASAAVCRFTGGASRGEQPTDAKANRPPAFRHFRKFDLDRHEECSVDLNAMREKKRAVQEAFERVGGPEMDLASDETPCAVRERAGGRGGGPATASDEDGKTPCAVFERMRRSGRLSHTCVPNMITALHYGYQQLHGAGVVLVGFESGAREEDTRRPLQRRLAATYLSEPAVDGWGICAGAIEIAKAWFLHTRELWSSVDSAFMMAAAFAVSIKYKKAYSVLNDTGKRYYCKFRICCHQSDTVSVCEGHTYELALLAFAMFPSEAQQQLTLLSAGVASADRVRLPDDADLVRRIHGIVYQYETMLVCYSDVGIMRCLEHNLLAEAEMSALAHTQDPGIFGCEVDADSGVKPVCALVRAILPFYCYLLSHADALYGSSAFLEETYGKEALVESLVLVGALHARCERSGETTLLFDMQFLDLFDAAAFECASNLMRVCCSIETTKRDARIGCYGDNAWKFREYVDSESMKNVFERANRLYSTSMKTRRRASRRPRASSQEAGFGAAVKVNDGT